MAEIPKTESGKLRLLANWLDITDRERGIEEQEVQLFLRELANDLEGSSVKELRNLVISGFYEEEYPSYQQGEPTHELQELVTAEELNGLIRVFKLQREALIVCKNLLEKPPEDHRMWIESKESAVKVAQNALAAKPSECPSPALRP